MDQFLACSLRNGQGGAQPAAMLGFQGTERSRNWPHGSGTARGESRQVELPFRDVGVDLLGCCSLLAWANGCVQVSGLIFMTRSRCRWGVLGSAPCDVDWTLTITLPCTSWDLVSDMLFLRNSVIMEGKQGLWKGWGTWPVMCCWPRSPWWVWVLSSVPVQADVSRNLFFHSVFVPRPLFAPWESYSVFLSLFWCLALQKRVCRDFCHL